MQVPGAGNWNLYVEFELLLPWNRYATVSDLEELCFPLVYPFQALRLAEDLVPQQMFLLATRNPEVPQI